MSHASPELRRSARRTPVLAVALAACGLALPAASWAQSGATFTPNQRNFMVNKDVGAERWTINVNLASGDLSSITNVTGNIFRSDGSPPSFVLCQVRPDSTGSLANPSSTFRLTCKGTDACQSTASQCARDDWQPINDDVPIAASFFLPPGGLGGISVGSAPGSGAAAAGDETGLVAGALARVAGALGSAARQLVQAAANRGPARPQGAASARGTTLSLDKLNFLVNKDVDTERWSISLNLVPVATPEGGVENRLESVTGNVYQPDGSPPSFVYCTQRPDSIGNLDDPSSQFRFTCQGTSACATTATDCAQNRWTPIADDIPLPASFFLPPGGLPASVQSDSDIIIIGRTSDPPAIVSKDFSASASAAAGAGADGSQATCAEGTTCFVTTVGRCSDVAGRQVQIQGFGCGCKVDPVPDSCVGCGGGASGQCGADCDYGVGAFTARGQCLPFSQETGDCICFAVGAGQQQTVQQCGGVLGGSCPGERCCADDPTDGCDPLAGNASCAGLCVQTEGCDPSSEQCGICLAPQGQFCGNDVREGTEACDGSDLDGETCQSRGFGSGTLRCTGSCSFDTSGCAAGGNNPPEITSIDFPSIVDSNGGPATGTVSFHDPDGDVSFIRFETVSGNLIPFSFDPDVLGDTTGDIGFFINCNGSTGSTEVAVTLEDVRDNHSNPVNFSFTCQSEAECGNDVVEAGELCDPPGTGSQCGAGEACTNDCTQCVSTTSCAGRCCPGRDDTCTPPGVSCYCDDACLSFSDCCADFATFCGS